MTNSMSSSGICPTVLLDGPKAVGKTAALTQRCRSFRHLDVAAECEIVEADQAIVGRDPAPLLVDEWQRVPAVFGFVRRPVDHDPTGGRFLLTGSAPTTQAHSGSTSSRQRNRLGNRFDSSVRRVWPNGSAGMNAMMALNGTEKDGLPTALNLSPERAQAT